MGHRNRSGRFPDSAFEVQRDSRARDSQFSADRRNTSSDDYHQDDQCHLRGVRDRLLRRRAGLDRQGTERAVRFHLSAPGAADIDLASSQNGPIAQWQTKVGKKTDPVSRGCSSWWTFLRLSRRRNARPSRQSSSAVIRRRRNHGRARRRSAIIVHNRQRRRLADPRRNRGRDGTVALGPRRSFWRDRDAYRGGRHGKDQRIGPHHGVRARKGGLTPILEARPPVAQELCRTLARLQAAGRLSASPELDQGVPKHRLTEWFSDRLHRLYGVVNVE